MPKTDLLAVWYLFIFLGFVPYVAIKSARLVRAGAPIPPRPRIFRRVLVMEGVFLLVALFAALTAHIDLLGEGDVHVGAGLAVATMLVVALSLQQVMWKFAPEELKRRSLLSRPNQPSELGWWSAVSLAAFSVGCHALVRHTGSLLPAMALHFLYDLGAGVAYVRFARRLQA